jgi:prophage DNA circulation protein
VTWDNELVTASFGGVEFAVEKTSDPLMRRWAEHKYPWKDGADIEDMGREPRRTTLTAIFLGDSASTDLGKLMLVIDAGKSATFTHPLLGSWTARMRAPDISANCSFRDGYRVELEVVEDGTATELPTVYSIDSLEDTLTADTSALEAAADAIDDASDAWDEAAAAIDDAVTAVNDLVSKAKGYASKVTQAMNKVRSTIKKAQKAIKRVASLGPSMVYGVNSALMKTASDCHKLAAAATSSLPKLVASTVTAGQSTALLAQALYGEASAANLALIESTSTIRNTAMIQPGTILIVPKP